MKKRINRIKNASVSLAAAVVCILIGLLVGLLVLLIINPGQAWAAGFMHIVKGGFYDMPYGVGRTITNIAPEILAGLSVGFAFKTGIFNIGVAGQYVVGAFGALLFALSFHCPWFVCLLVAILFGAIWGAIPGIFKAYLNVNEVITAIMFNWIGLYAVNEIVYNTSSMYNSYRTSTYQLITNNPAAVIPSLGLDKIFKLKSTGSAVFIAIFISIIVYIILNRTTFGYELKAVGHNKNAARYAGINEKRNIIFAMMISGALAGCAAGVYYLSGASEWHPLQSTALPAIGWDGIPVALLADSHPIGIIFSAFLISHIEIGGSYLPQNYFPTEIANVVTGIIIYLCAFSFMFRDKLLNLLRLRSRKKPELSSKQQSGAESEEGGLG